MGVNAWLLLGALCVWGYANAQVPDVSAAAVDELGTTYGMPQMSGFVFIDGRYIPPPYTVTRKGNGIFINRILIEKPAVWPRGGDAAQEAKKAIDQDGDFEVVAPEQVQPAPAPKTAKAVKSIDDLFADEDAPASTEAEQTSAAPGMARPAKPVTARTPEAAEGEKARVIEGLDRIRNGYEQALALGEIYLFGQRHNRVNGTYGTARTLMSVLPKALRYAASPEDLQQRLRQGGVYFVDRATCVELFKHKTTFPQLEERWRRIEESEALEAQRRKARRGW